MRTEKSSQWSYTVLVVLSLVLLGLVISPFASAFFLAAALAGALWPAQQWLARRLGERRSLASGLLCAAVVLALVLPIAGVGAFVVREGLAGARWAAQALRTGGAEGLLARLPASFREQVEKLEERFDLETSDLQEAATEKLQGQGSKAARVLSGTVAAAGAFAVQSVMMLIALFFLLVDGAALVAWLERISPLRRGETGELLTEFRKVTVSVLLSAIATAGVQAAAALIGYLIAKVPYPLFWTVLTFFIAFVPAAGAAGVCLAAALVVLALGHTWAALFLAVWAVLVVGLVDNIVKPLLVRRGLDMHGAVVFFALLGGLAVFGGVGLLLGPLIVSLFLALMRIRERHEQLEAPLPVPAVGSSGTPGVGPG